MAYASRSDLIGRVKALDSTTYAASAIVESLEVQGSLLTARLRRAYPAPLSVPASALVALSANVSDGNTVTIGAKTYRFKNTPVAINDVQIGATAAATIVNLRRTINQQGGSAYFTGTTVNDDVRGVSSGAACSLYARKAGPEGNDLALSAVGAVITVTAFSGGAREFPELVQCNIWMTAIQLLSGQATSAVSGSGTRTNIDDMRDQLAAALGLLDAGYPLTDTEGVVFSPSSGGMYNEDENYPIADMGDPVHWQSDPDRVFDRE